MNTIAKELQKQGISAISVNFVSQPFIRAKRADGSIVVFGNQNDNWGGEIYLSEADYSNGDYMDSKDTGLPGKETDPVEVVRAFITTFGR